MLVWISAGAIAHLLCAVTPPDAPELPLMIGLSVAVGRFVEALFWAIARVVGAVAGAAIVVVLGLAAAALLVRAVLRRRRR